jgi:predicted transcriptional regulator
MAIKLTNKEKIVLNVVQEYLDKNRQFNMKKIQPFINSRFRMASIDISNYGIETILRSLVQKDLLVEGSKLTHEDILFNLKRADIYNFIRKYPGVYFNKIIKELKLSNHIVVWHLNMLLKFNFIKKGLFDKHEIYFDSNLEFENVKIIYITAREKSKKIIEYLKNNDIGVTKTHLSKKLGMHPNTIKKYLNFLEEFNVIFKEKLSKKTLYFLNEVYIN